MCLEKFFKFQIEDFFMLFGIEFQILAPVNLMDFFCSLNNGVCKFSLVVDLVE